EALQHDVEIAAAVALGAEGLTPFDHEAAVVQRDDMRQEATGASCDRARCFVQRLGALIAEAAELDSVIVLPNHNETAVPGDVWSASIVEADVGKRRVLPADGHYDFM